MSLLCSKFDREKSFTAVSDLQNVTAEANKIFLPDCSILSHEKFVFMS